MDTPNIPLKSARKCLKEVKYFVRKCLGRELKKSAYKFFKNKFTLLFL